jgi:4-amino-4-deoxy-L-arabinose transferase
VTEHAAGPSRTLPWLVALFVLLAFAFQGTRGLWEPDEGRYSSAGINMQESGDWLVPSIDGEHPHLTKPPMTYWALASSFALLGHNEWAARLPSALAFIGTGLFVFGLGRRLCPAKPWLPPMVWGLSFAPAIASNIVSTDPLLTLFETASMYAFVEAWSRSGADARRWFIYMWLGWGLTFMTKGPPGLLPLLGMALFLALHDRRRLRELVPLAGLLVFAVVAFAWFAVVIAQDTDRLRYFLGYEVYDRVFTSVHSRNAQWYGGLLVYVPMLVFGTLPWSVFALVAAGGPRSAWGQFRSRLRERQPHWLLLTYWLTVPLLVFFLARSRLQLYILPLFVPLALMMARAVSHWPSFAGRRALAIIVTTAVALIALKGVVAYSPSDRDSRALAAQVRAIIEPRDFDRIVFVDIKPFYGLNVYLDRHTAGISSDSGPSDANAAYKSRGELCDELAKGHRDVYAVKHRRVDRLLAAAQRCGGRPAQIGTVHADGADIDLFRLHTDSY